MAVEHLRTAQSNGNFRDYMFEGRSSLRQRFRLVILSGALFWTATLASATDVTLETVDFTLESAGARYGFPENTAAKGFRQFDIFSNYDLPWHWHVGTDIDLQTRLGLSIGWIGAHDNDAFVGTIGPSLIFSRHQIPLNLDFGVSPTILSRNEWGTVNVGSLYQFTSHAGVNWDMTSHLRLGYRFSHMSNGGLVHPNPGLNMHMVEVSFVF